MWVVWSWDSFHRVPTVKSLIDWGGFLHSLYYACMKMQLDNLRLCEGCEA